MVEILADSPVGLSACLVVIANVKQFKKSIQPLDSIQFQRLDLLTIRLTVFGHFMQLFDTVREFIYNNNIFQMTIWR